MRALYAAASGMNAQQVRLDTIANNLANVSTTSFKKSRESFQDLFYQEVSRGGLAASSARIQVGTGVALSSVEKDFSNGQLLSTGNPLDVAINGRGFFLVTDIDGNRFFTRDGAMTLDQNGTLITANGLQYGRGITLPPETEEVKILEDGTVMGRMPNDPSYTTLGQLEMVTFNNPTGLKSMGGNLFQETPTSGMMQFAGPMDNIRLQQGFLEGSNVDVAEELIAMIQTQRAYELNSKAVQAADDTLRVATNLRR